MGASLGTGGTLRESLESVWQQTGIKPPELEEATCPDAIAHVWRWFMKLHQARGSGGMGPSGITYQDIAAWSALTHSEPSPFEVGCIMALDSVWMLNQLKDAT